MGQTSSLATNLQHHQRFSDSPPLSVASTPIKHNFTVSSTPQSPQQDNINLSISLGMPPPVHPVDDGNSAKVIGFYHSRNLCWLWGLIIPLILCGILGSVMDNGLYTSWSSQGASRWNDRNVMVSSLFDGNIDLASPSFIIPRNKSTSSTPAIWNGRVFWTTYDGLILAIHAHTGDVLWELNLCQDVYNLLPGDCILYLRSQKYISVATPTVWGANLIIAVKKPADILVIRQHSGEMLFKATLDANPRSQLTQSPTIIDDSLYIGTSISDEDSVEDSEDCSFTGKMFRWDLEDMQPVCSLTLGDEAKEFSGMRVAGSSPPLSWKHGLVAFAVGPSICTPSWYKNCLTPDSVTNQSAFDVSGYESEFENCHVKSSAKHAHFNSILVMRTEDCSIAWSQKLLRYSAWSLACLNNNPPDNPCAEFVNDPSMCDFFHNPYLNCPTEYQSAVQNYDWVDDPVLKGHGAMKEQVLLAAQKSGIVYSFKLNEAVSRRKSDADDGQDSDDKRNHVEWAISVSPGEQLGGLAIRKEDIYFSFLNLQQLPWIHDNSLGGTLCGGWGSLHASTGLPKWYKVHPMCNRTFYGFNATCDLNSVSSSSAGSQSAPSLSNDLVFVTGSDSNGAPSDQYQRGGHIYALRAKDGSVSSSLETFRPFEKQGFSLHGRCIYTGGGRSTDDSTSFMGWCTKGIEISDC